MTSPTTNYGWIKPDVGASTDAWGGILNSDLDGIDSTVNSVSNVANAALPSATASTTYVAKAGDTMTGQLNINVASVGTSLVISPTAAVGASIVLNKQSGQGNNVWGQQAGSNRWQLLLGNSTAEGAGNAGSDMTLNAFDNTGASLGTPLLIARSSGNATFSNIVSTLGYAIRAGTGGASVGFTNPFNFYWTGTVLQAWIGSTNAGTVSFTSDYRTKKDVTPLPSTWDRVKALRPISYTHQDFTPPIELQRDAEAKPLIVGDDVERWGFIAHELQETLIMDAATGVKDQEDCIQSPNVMTVVATLTKALQEAMARIEALEAARG